MNQQIIGTEYISSAKKNKVIKTSKDLKTTLIDLLIHFEYELPRDFNFIKLPDLIENYRFMNNFNRSYAFEKNIIFLKDNLKSYFDYDSELEQQIYLEKQERLNGILRQSLVEQDAIQVKENLDQNKIDVVSQEINDVLIEEEDNFEIKSDINRLGSENLQEISTDDLDKTKDSISINTDITVDINKDSVPKSLTNDTKYTEITKEPVQLKIGPEEIENQDTIIQSEQEPFNFSDSIELVEKNEINSSISKDEALNETLAFLGLGSLKKNITQKIITGKKVNIGLSFDEWVNIKENKLWVRLLLIKLNKLESIDLSIESNLLERINKYNFSNKVGYELNNLYEKLKLV